ncbi:hypothetical protein CHS0354_020838 [Potamilus streckersoni]|uniref:Homeodomain-only protein n=1 Tax=Potamilus streckersoni TaxID=2493646 RepID=A0AAE0RUK5_9BIVA|nr:hypothetical protein CHS0354_020838 [Potamilus streckersoni]
MDLSKGSIRAHLTEYQSLPRLSLSQTSLLEENFKQNRNPTELEVVLYAAEAGITEEDVKKWFQHRLAVWRQQQGLPANSGHINS